MAEFIMEFLGTRRASMRAGGKNMDHQWYLETMIDTESARAQAIAAYAIAREWMPPPPAGEEYDEGGES